MSKPFTTEKFINDAIIRFSHKFDYSKVCYRNATTKVTIICPDHGEFSISPWKFLNSKHGCKRCAINSMAEQQKTITQEKLAECKKTNSNRYEYPAFSFNSIKDKIPVLCKKHGLFHVTVDHHLHGVGCKKCADASKIGGYSEHWFESSPKRKTIPGLLYIIEVYNDEEKFIKIGITKNSVEDRYKYSMNKKYKYKIIHQSYHSLYECFAKESAIKNQFNTLMYKSKHNFHPTETFYFTALSDILQLLNG